MENRKLAAKLVNFLKNKGLFITTVESCTGGGLSNIITDIAGASEVMKGAFVTYSNEQKIALGVPAEIIEKYTVYSLETAKAMAESGLKAAVKADIAVGITGSISRKDPANPSSVPGKVYIAVKYKHDRARICAMELELKDDERWRVKEVIITTALDMVLSFVQSMYM